MSSINKVMLIGNLGADPELRFMPSGEAVCTIRLATTEKWKDKSTGELREATEWHRVVLFRRRAEIAAQYLRKGSQVYIEGRLQTRKWQDKEGRDRYTTEIEGRDLTFLGSRPAHQYSQPLAPGVLSQHNSVKPAVRSCKKVEIDPWDVPF